MAPALSRTLALGASSVAALRPSPSRGLPRGALVPQGRRCARGVRWDAGRGERVVGARCVSAVAEKAAAEEEEEAAGEKFEYQAEVSRLMDLIVHSLYSHKEVFLRELVSNASDALDKLRFLSVTDPSMLADGSEMEIRIKPDPEAGTITITDSGIGMTKDELKDCLGTIAQSGTSKFLKALKENKELGADNGLIGQFGVGFYSAFLVAEKIVVSTKSPKVDKQYVWEAEANSSSYVIKEETDPEKMLTRGTQITPFLRVMLLGHSDSYLKDKAMQVTIAFNHFGEGLIQRMPRCRHGYFHVVNNDYTHWEMYAIGGSAEPTINSQGNRYLAPTNPFAKEVQYPYQCTIITVNWFSDQHFSFFIFHYAIFHLLTVGAEEPGDQPDSAPV